MLRLGTRSTLGHWQILQRRKNAPLPRPRRCRVPSPPPRRPLGQACPEHFTRPPSSPSWRAINRRLAARPQPPLIMRAAYSGRRARGGRPSRCRSGTVACRALDWRAFTGKRPRGTASVSGRTRPARSAAKSRPIDLPRARHLAFGIFSRRIFARRHSHTRSGWPGEAFIS